VPRVENAVNLLVGNYYIVEHKAYQGHQHGQINPDPNPSCGNVGLLRRGRLQHRGKSSEKGGMVEDHLILGPIPPLRSLLWLSP
jgi:hypothetical protein